MLVVVTERFQLLYALVVLGHERRKVIHFDVTQKPTQSWLARQITEAFPWDTAPRFLLRDATLRIGTFRDDIQAMAIEEVVMAGTLRRRLTCVSSSRELQSTWWGQPALLSRDVFPGSERWPQ